MKCILSIDYSMCTIHYLRCASFFAKLLLGRRERKGEREGGREREDRDERVRVSEGGGEDGRAQQQHRHMGEKRRGNVGNEDSRDIEYAACRGGPCSCSGGGGAAVLRCGSRARAAAAGQE